MRSWLLFLLLLPAFEALAQTRITAVDYRIEQGRAYLALSADGPLAQHELQRLHNPDRLVLDLMNSVLVSPLPRPAPDDPLALNVRSGVRDGVDVRLVLDLKDRSLLDSRIRFSAQTGNQLVLEMDLRSAGAAPAKTRSSEPAFGSDFLPKQELPQRKTNLVAGDTKGAKAMTGKGRDIVIAIDAGHGGKDPGALGARGTHEKDITLAVARRLAQIIGKEQGLKPVLVRNADIFISLRDRMAIARSHKADLFVSIHADAFKNPDVKGSSVFTLSRSGASSEAARWLADRENSADLMGGVSLEGKDQVLASVLLDLSQSATIQASSEVAEQVLNKLGGLGDLHIGQVQQAGFAVLKSPDIPSLLVETAFISNPDEERKLKDPKHQTRLASAIARGVREYFYSSPPAGTLIAQRQNRQKQSAASKNSLAEVAGR